MIKIKLIVFGKLKEEYLREACNEYKKRLTRYCDLEVIELSPVKLPEKPSESQVSAALLKEAQLVQSKIPQGAFICSLCIEGKQMGSEDFSSVLQKISQEGRTVCFIVGSSYGLCSSVKNDSHMRLSLSKMTFPHQLFRVMLLEQLYRGFQIAEGGAYHK